MYAQEGSARLVYGECLRMPSSCCMVRSKLVCPGSASFSDMSDCIVVDIHHRKQFLQYGDSDSQVHVKFVGSLPPLPPFCPHCANGAQRNSVSNS